MWPGSACVRSLKPAVYDGRMNATDIAAKFADLERHIDRRFAAVERLQYWTLGIIGSLFAALLVGAFGIIAALPD